jgi:methionyl-tRNA formyltransferase
VKIALIGQAAFGNAVLEALLKQGEDSVVGVFCPPDAPGQALDPVKEAARAAAIPCFQFKRLRSAEAIAQFRALAPDLGVMAFVTDIVPVEILQAPRLGTIQYHPSLLPRHRGPSSINWPIIFGEKETGLTIFWPDAGLDTGPILLQKRTPIGPDDTQGSVYFERLFPMGVEALVEAVALVRAGRAPRIAQDESQASYEGWCRDEHAAIDWSQPAQRVYDLIRGCNPRPGAHTLCYAARLRVFDCELRAGDPGGAPGTVVALGAAGFEVAAGSGGRLLVKRVQPEGGRKLPAAEYAASTRLTVGGRLGA